MPKELNVVQVVIIGGGFYGLRIALFLAEELGVEDILVIEKESTLMSRASYVNQARVHNGYHYPRSVLTGYRSAVNFSGFVEEYKPAIVSNFDKYYAIARQFSKINALQFKGFCRKINVDIEQAPSKIKNLFNPQLTEDVFKVREYAFDSHKLRDLLLERARKHPGIRIQTGDRVKKVSALKEGVKVVTDSDVYQADRVFNCTYSQINSLHRASDLPLLALKHEITEMCLVELPERLKHFSITMMDGPFFSIMPFPSRGLYTLSHVRYTPHESWIDNQDTDTEMHDTHVYFKNKNKRSNFKQMYADVVRYLPSLKDMKYVDSIREVKTVLVKSEGDDSRPILFRSDFGLKNYTCIMGGKLDNIYDVFEELRNIYGEK